MKATINHENKIQPFSVTFDIETKRDLLEMYHVSNMSSRCLKDSIKAMESDIPVPNCGWMNLNRSVAAKCRAEIDRLGGLDDVGTDDKQVDTKDSCEWLKWEGKHMKPGMYQIRGPGYGASADHCITISRNPAHEVICSWTESSWSLSEFSRLMHGDSIEYKIIRQF